MVEERGTIVALRRRVEVRRQDTGHHANTQPVEGDTNEAAVEDTDAQLKIQLKGMTDMTTLRLSTMMMGSKVITYHNDLMVTGNLTSQWILSSENVQLNQRGDTRLRSSMRYQARHRKPRR